MVSCGSKPVTYKSLGVRQQHVNMKIITATLLAVVVLTGITGHLFWYGDDAEEDPSVEENPHHAALVKLLKTSESAIQWIGNKTTSGLQTVKNLTSTVGSEDTKAALATRKKKFEDWLKKTFQNKLKEHHRDVPDRADPILEDVTPEDSSLEDSDENVAIVHRTKDDGTSWVFSGLAKNNSREGEASRIFKSAGRAVQSVFSYLYQGTKDFTQRGGSLIANKINKVFKTKGPTSSKSTETLASNPGYAGGGTLNCDDNLSPVCAVDQDRRYTVFQNECRMTLYNYNHGTNFRVHDSNVCMLLLARYPNLFLNSPETHMEY